jgi:hypothetical protein
MIAPRILGFVAIAALVTAAVIGYRSLRTNAALRKAIGAFLYCSFAGLTTSFIRAPLIVWSLGLSIGAAMVYLIWTIQIERKRCECGVDPE